MRSHAASQFENGPAQTIGVPPTNRMSPVNTTPASGTWTIASPSVCAGPTSIELTARPPTVERRAGRERRRRQAHLDPLEPERRRRSAGTGRRPRPTVGLLERVRAAAAAPRPSRPRPRPSRRSRRRPAAARCRSSGRRWRACSSRCRSGPRSVTGRIASSISRVRSRSKSVSTSSDVPPAGDQPGVAPAPRPVGLEVRKQPVTELVQPALVGDRHGRCLPGCFASLSGGARRSCGGVAEWLNAAVSKTVSGVKPLTRVRIPPPP